MLLDGEVPLAQTKITPLLCPENRPSGINLSVCILGMDGYSADDAVVFASSTAQTAANVLCMKTFSSDKDLTIRGIQETLTDLRDSNRASTWTMFGSMPVGSQIKPCWNEFNDSHERPFLKCGGNKNTNPTALPLRLDRVHYTSSAFDGNGPIFQLDGTTTQIRSIVTGSKIADRHAQKGVPNTYPDYCMFYDPSNGMRPDIFVNIYAPLNRATFGKILEMVASVVACVSVRDIREVQNHDAWYARARAVCDGTAFEDHDLPTMEQLLKDAGFETDMRTVLVNPITNQTVVAAVGMQFWQVLKHHVADKVQARTNGVTARQDAITGQPVEGRQRQVRCIHPGVELVLGMIFCIRFQLNPEKNVGCSFAGRRASRGAGARRRTRPRLLQHHRIHVCVQLLWGSPAGVPEVPHDSSCKSSARRGRRPHMHDVRAGWRCEVCGFKSKLAQHSSQVRVHGDTDGVAHAAGAA